jgi:mono/diheme cytochrome c family protein
LTDLPFPPQNPTSTTLLATSMPGYKLYMNTCTGCHGQDLEGSVGPELRGLGNVTTSAKLDKFITTGKEGMPPGGELSSPVQIQEVADWLAKQTQK